MGRRKYPFNKHSLNFGTNLVSSLLAGLIIAPFTCIDTSSNAIDDFGKSPISKSEAITLIIIGLFLTPLLFYISSLFLFFVVWGAIALLVIESFSSHYANNTTNNVNNKNFTTTKTLQSKYEDVVNVIAQNINTIEHNKIKKEYDDIIDFNKNIENKKQILNEQIKNYKKKIKYFQILPAYKKEYNKKIEMILCEISSLDQQIKKPSIILDETTLKNTRSIKSKGHIYLLINKNIDTFNKIDFSKLPRRKKKSECFFEVSHTPLCSLCFSSIELYFYSNIMLIMSKDKFAIINYDNISIKSKIIKIDTCNLEYASNFKIINEKWEHTCLDGTPDLRCKNNTKKIFIEVATLELKIFTQTITFLLNAEDNVFSFISTLKH